MNSKCKTCKSTTTQTWRAVTDTGNKIKSHLSQNVSGWKKKSVFKGLLLNTTFLNVWSVDIYMLILPVLFIMQRQMVLPSSFVNWIKVIWHGSRDARQEHQEEEKCTHKWFYSSSSTLNGHCKVVLSYVNYCMYLKCTCCLNILEKQHFVGQVNQLKL